MTPSKKTYIVLAVDLGHGGVRARCLRCDVSRGVVAELRTWCKPGGSRSDQRRSEGHDASAC